MPSYSVKNGNMIVNLVVAESFEHAEELFGKGNILDGLIPIRSSWSEEEQKWIDPIPLSELNVVDEEAPTEG